MSILYIYVQYYEQRQGHGHLEYKCDEKQVSCITEKLGCLRIDITKIKGKPTKYPLSSVPACLTHLTKPVLTDLIHACCVVRCNPRPFCLQLNAPFRIPAAAPERNPAVLVHLHIPPRHWQARAQQALSCVHHSAPLDCTHPAQDANRRCQRVSRRVA
jgi:hypothetical protein